MIRATHSPLYVVQELLETRYKGAEIIFLAGSVARGEAGSYSDVDLVVVYPRVETAFRESFYHRDWPVEAFVHDPETLRYFFLDVDRPIGSGSLAEMVSEGLEVPSPTAVSDALKAFANQVLGEGPPGLTEDQVRDRRYAISELLDDIREPRSRQELYASSTILYNEMADYFLRSRRSWAASGKGVIKRLKKTDLVFARKFLEAFDVLFATGRQEKVIELGEDVLGGPAGLLFDGYRRDAQPGWRRN